MRLPHVLPVLALLGLLAPMAPLRAQEPLETETARLLPQGRGEASVIVEHQTSSAGRETAVPLSLGYGLTDRLELLVEPVVSTTISPSLGRRTRGGGDVEVTLTYLMRHENTRTPALAFAGEVKLPTARNSRIGTGRTDVAGYLIASKRFGRLDAHANVGYTVVGQPDAGAHLNNILFLAVAGDYRLAPKFDLVGEVFGNTSSTSSSQEAPDGGTLNGPSPEAATGEVVGMLGARYHLLPDRTLFLAVTRDNARATLVRTGVTFSF